MRTMRLSHIRATRKDVLMTTNRTPPAPRRGAAIALVLVLAALAVLLLAIVLTSAIRCALSVACEAQQAQIADALTPIDIVVAAGWRLLPLLLALCASAVGLTIAYRRWGQIDIIRADKTIA